MSLKHKIGHIVCEQTHPVFIILGSTLLGCSLIRAKRFRHRILSTTSSQQRAHIRERFPNNPYFSVDITRSTPLPKTMIFKKETKDNELYLYMNGKLIYKKWLATGVSKVFDIQAYDKYTLTSIKDIE
jgi:hypothetical protein